jgi:hypothetical protein
VEPTDTYLKAKRSLLIFSGALALIVLVGVNPSSPNATHLFPFELRRPSLIAYAILVVVLYLLVEVVSYWSSQKDEIATHPSHKRIHFFLIWIALGASALQLYSMGFSPYQNIEVAPHSYDETFQWGWKEFGFVFVVSLAISALVINFTPILKRMRVSRISKEEYFLSTLLVNRLWVLEFNPQDPKGRKDISFRTNGIVGQGRNQNEDRWRTRGSYLEILNPSGQVFSRFIFDKSSGSFFHTNDEDTLSLRNQKIYPRKRKKPKANKVTP